MLLLPVAVSAHTVTLTVKFNISDSDTVYINSSSYGINQSANQSWANLTKKYIGSSYDGYSAGMVFTGEDFIQVSLDSERIFRMKQGDENKFSLFFTKTDWSFADNRILSAGRLMRTTFGQALSLINPSSVFLQLHYSYIDIINDEQWGSGSHEILIKNTGRLNGKNTIKIEKVR